MGPLIEPEATHSTPVSHDPFQSSAVRQPSAQAIERERRRYGYVSQGLATGEPQAFSNKNGQRVQLSVSRNRDQSGYQNYTMTIDGRRVSVALDPKVDNVVALGRLANLYSEQPANFRGAVDTFKVESGPNPRNPEWEKKYNIPGFRSAATGGGGNITFYEGLSQIKESVMNHEFGHNIGGAVRAAQDREARAAGRLRAERRADTVTGDNANNNIPRGYAQAVKSDGNAVSDYGTRSLGEDFAEFYELYREASNKGPRQLERFKNTYPVRYALFEQEVLSRRLSSAR